MILRNRDTVIRNAKELLEAYHKFASPDGGKYDFVVAEEIGSFVRTEKEQRDYIVIKNIRTIHCISSRGAGLRATKLTCHQCVREDRTCDICEQLPFTVKPDKVAKQLAQHHVQVDVGDLEELSEHAQLDPEEEVGEDEGGTDPVECAEQSDIEDGSDSEDEGEEEGPLYPVGTVCWGLRYGRRAPAIVIEFDSIPDERKKTLRTKKPFMVHIEFLGISKFATVHEAKLVKLGDTMQDLRWAQGNVNYQLALTMLPNK